MKVYIGDGVYAEIDGMGMWLTTQRAGGEHQIYLEPQMLRDLNDYSIAHGWRPEPSHHLSRRKDNA